MNRISRSTLLTVIILVVAVILSEAGLKAQDTDPRYTSWHTSPSGTYARLYESTVDINAGNATTTWTRGQGTQSTPAYAGVTRVSYSDDWVYIQGSGLGFHVMGPWFLNEADSRDFPNFPANTDVLYRIPRNPTVATTKTVTNTGAIGYFVDGVAMFDYTDTFSYSNANAADASPVASFQGRGDGIWNRDAYINEGVTFDPAFAHQAGQQYHYHANAPALRYQLGDNVDYDSSTRTYSESSSAPTQHSPIVAWARDGYPVYGPYGYDDPDDDSSGIRRMISGYVKRDGNHGTTNLNTTGRTTLPAWAATAQNRGATLSANETGPNVSTDYILGHYLEDYDYLGDLGQTQGTDFDLDLYNGRFCVTPEFPNGTYAYFLSIEADGTPKYPYILGRWFYGEPVGEAVNSITENVVEYLQGAPSAPLIVSTTASGEGVEVAWNSVEGATYTVESSPDQMNWSTLTTSVASTGITTTYTAPTADFFRVTLSNIASYDTDGTNGTAVGSTGTASWSAAEVEAPVISTSPTTQSIAGGASTTLTVNASGDALTYQWYKDGALILSATDATFTISTAAAYDAGEYTAAVTNAGGTALSDTAQVTVTGSTASATARIVNLSTRTSVGGDAGTPVIGMVIGGTGSKSVLVRAVGPTLASFMVAGALADPQLDLISSGDQTIVASNDNWGAAANLSTLVSTSSAVGAFALTADSADAAWLGDLAAGSYTAPVLDDRGSGIVLLEMYDAGAETDTAKLLNASTRAHVSSGDGVLISGFVIQGEGTRRILIRGVGPTLTNYQVPDVLADPNLKLFSGLTELTANDNWGENANAAAISVAASEYGAFAIDGASRDAAIFANLPAGSYTVQLAGASTTTGTALLEVYLLD
ncbi:MAG: hypothetical protein SynsKO_07540 [Synoicihabitans sp.]